MRRIHPVYLLSFLSIFTLVFGLLFTVYTVKNQRDTTKKQLNAVVKTADQQHQDDLNRIATIESELADARRAADEARTAAAQAKAHPRIVYRASRSRRLSPPVQNPVDSGSFASAEAWANSPFARKVAYCESGRDGSAVSHSGKYRGKWQMDADFWRTYGGLRYASSPELASEAQQDAVAYRGWQARGWQPWSCSHMV